MVPRTCPPPRLSIPVLSELLQEQLERRGGVVGERAGKIGHRRASFYPPFPRHDPEKIVPGEGGVEGGVISSQYQTRPYPLPGPHPWHGQNGPKSPWQGWGQVGGRGGGNTSSIIIRAEGLPGQAHLPKTLGFWGKILQKKGKNPPKEGKMLPVFFFFLPSNLCHFGG